MAGGIASIHHFFLFFLFFFISFIVTKEMESEDTQSSREMEFDEKTPEIESLEKKIKEVEETREKLHVSLENVMEQEAIVDSSLNMHRDLHGKLLEQVRPSQESLVERIEQVEFEIQTTKQEVERARWKLEHIQKDTEMKLEHAQKELDFLRRTNEELRMLRRGYREGRVMVLKDVEEMERKVNRHLEVVSRLRKTSIARCEKEAASVMSFWSLIMQNLDARDLVAGDLDIDEAENDEASSEGVSSVTEDDVEEVQKIWELIQTQMEQDNDSDEEGNEDSGALDGQSEGRDVICADDN
jgi:hypothetical protein